MDPRYGGAIGFFSIDGLTSNEIASRLYKEFKVHTVAINWEKIKGVRVTPNVYTVTTDLDRLIKGIEVIAG